MPISVKKFTQQLLDFEADTVFNPYSDTCPVFDKKNAHHVRRKNLWRLLNTLKNKPVDAIWIGRDLGYLGGRRTGLALTDESHLEAAGKLWGVKLDQATKGAAISERTAANIWNHMRLVNSHVFTWNVFPFHPHLPEKPFSNRSHTAKERDIGLAVLESLLHLLRPNKIVAIGNDAYQGALKLQAHHTVFKIRHPSYGGVKAFSQQISQLYGLEKRC